MSGCTKLLSSADPTPEFPSFLIPALTVDSNGFCPVSRPIRPGRKQQRRRRRSVLSHATDFDQPTLLLRLIYICASVIKKLSRFILVCRASPSRDRLAATWLPVLCRVGKLATRTTTSILVVCQGLRPKLEWTAKKKRKKEKEKAHETFWPLVTLGVLFTLPFTGPGARRRCDHKLYFIASSVLLSQYPLFTLQTIHMKLVGSARLAGMPHP